LQSNSEVMAFAARWVLGTSPRMTVVCVESARFGNGGRVGTTCLRLAARTPWLVAARATHGVILGLVPRTQPSTREKLGKVFLRLCP
jgi:hypothetical protein